MKRKIYTSLLLSLFFISVKAQCPFDPTVTPVNLVLCPNSSDTLWTQIYNSYQWYKNSVLIAGATNQYLVVHDSEALSSFAVEATDSSCTEMSPPVTIDAYAFLPPVVMHQGDLGWFDGQYLNLCTGDTLILILMQPYEVNIQWYNGSSPIAGATDDTLLVTASGPYWVEGAPAICPNFILQLGVSIDVIVHQPVIPVITMVNDTLYANPPGTSYQWYFYLNPIPNATNQWYYPTTPGSYTVSVLDSNQCNTMSDPFIVASVETIHSPDGINIIYDGNVISVENVCAGNELKMFDITGRLKEKSSGKTSYQINAQSYDDGMYLLTLQCGTDFLTKKIIVKK